VDIDKKSKNEES